MCVLTVQSDVGYATHVSTKPLPIWSSSRKDWSDWSMEPAYEFANRARATSVRISSLSRGTNPTAIHRASNDGLDCRVARRTNERSMRVRVMDACHPIAHRTPPKARRRHPRANTRWMDGWMDDDDWMTSKLDKKREGTYHNLARAGRARARAARVREINASFLFTCNTSHRQSRRLGARARDHAFDPSIDRSIEGEVGSRRSTTWCIHRHRARRDVARVTINPETNHTKKHRRRHARTRTRTYLSRVENVRVIRALDHGFPIGPVEGDGVLGLDRRARRRGAARDGGRARGGERRGGHGGGRNREGRHIVCTTNVREVVSRERRRRR